jgi:hypothetical protein
MKTKFTQKEHAESGLALIIILLAASLLVPATILVQIAIGLLILDMTVPLVFYPFTLLWLNLSHVLGRIISFIILTLIFLLVVTPTALVRRLIGKDRLLLSEFKKSSASIFHDRNHRFVKEDSLHPF